MDVGAGDRADHVGGGDRLRRGLVEARGIAHRPFDEMVQERDGDIDEEQAGDRLVDAAIMAQAADQRDPGAAREHAGASHGELDRERRATRQREPGGGRRQPADDEGALAADDDHAELRRERGAERGQDEGRGAGQRVLPGEPGAEGAAVHEPIELERVDAREGDEDAEQHRRGEERQKRHRDGLGGAARTVAAAVHRPSPFSPIATVMAQEVEPMTPSMR